MFEKFARSSREAVVRAVEAAHGRDEGKVTPADLLAAVVAEREGAAALVLQEVGVDLTVLAHELERRRSGPLAALGEADAAALASVGIDLDEVLRRLGGPAPRVRRRGWGGPFGAPAKRALRSALDEAVALRHGQIGTEHLLLGLVRGGDPVVVDALAACGASYDGLRDAVRAAVRRAG